MEGEAGISREFFDGDTVGEEAFGEVFDDFLDEGFHGCDVDNFEGFEVVVVGIIGAVVFDIGGERFAVLTEDIEHC